MTQDSRRPFRLIVRFVIPSGPGNQNTTTEFGEMLIKPGITKPSSIEVPAQVVQALTFEQAMGSSGVIVENGKHVRIPDIGAHSGSIVLHLTSASEIVWTWKW